MSFHIRLGLPLLGALLVTACGGSGGTVSGGDGPPAVISESPLQVTGAEQTIEMAFSNPGGLDKILIVQMMIAPNLTTPNSCWMEYGVVDGAVKMMDGSGKGKAGEAGTLSNSRCSIDPAQVKHTVNGTTLKVSVPVRLTPAVLENQNIFALASAASQHSGWHQVGTWTREAAAK